MASADDDPALRAPAAGRVPTAAMVDSPYAEVIGCIGRCDPAASLVDAFADPHWRVRMAADRALAHVERRLRRYR